MNNFYNSTKTDASSVFESPLAIAGLILAAIFVVYWLAFPISTYYQLRKLNRQAQETNERLEELCEYAEKQAKRNDVSGT